MSPTSRHLQLTYFVTGLYHCPITNDPVLFISMAYLLLYFTVQQSLFCYYCDAAGDEVGVPTTATSTSAVGSIGYSPVLLRQLRRPTVTSDGALHNCSSSRRNKPAAWNYAATAINRTETRDVQGNSSTGVSAVD